MCLASHFFLAQSNKINFMQRELGFFGGGSYYIGDINSRGHFLNSHPAGGIYFRYCNTYRTAFRFSLNYGEISANDANSDEANQKERNLSFSSKLYEFSSVAEFNFVEYRIGHERHKFTMFLFAGLSAFYFNPTIDLGFGKEYLSNYNTEGQAYPKIQLGIPFGIGIKMNIGKKVGIGIEWGPRKTFTDYLDDVSGSYPETPVYNSNGINLSDRTIDGSSSFGNMRGNPSNKDWYFYYGLTLNFKLPDPNKKCHGRGKGETIKRFKIIF